MGRVLTGQPSSLARALANDIAGGNLECANCTAVVACLWKRHLSSSVKAQIANVVITKENFKSVCQQADNVHQSNNPAPSVSAVRKPASQAAAAATSPLNETQPGLAYPVPEVNAVRNNGRGGRGGRGFRGGRGNRGGGRGGGNNQSNQNSGTSTQSGPRHKGTKHPDLPAGEWLGCSMHFKFGRQAFFCAEPATCPWKNVYTPKPSNN